MAEAQHSITDGRRTMKVVIIGGTGLIGSKLVGNLREHGSARDLTTDRAPPHDNRRPVDNGRAGNRTTLDAADPRGQPPGLPHILPSHTLEKR